MSIATTCTASRQAGVARPASTRRHRRCGPPPGPACPASRTGRRSRCATGPPAARTPRSARRAATGPVRAGARQCPGARPEQPARPGPGWRRRRRRRGRQPGDPGVPGRLCRGDPAVGDLAGGLLPQPPGDPALRRHGRQPFRERPARAGLCRAFPPPLDPSQVHRVAARRTSRGRVTTVSCSREDTVPQSGQAAAAGQSVTVHTSTAPPGPACTSATRSPSTPDSADAASWNTMPGTAGCPFSAGQVPAEMCSTALPWNRRSSSACATWPISRQSASAPRCGVSFPSPTRRDQPLEPEGGRLPFELVVEVQDVQAGPRRPPHSRHVDRDLVAGRPGRDPGRDAGSPGSKLRHRLGQRPAAQLLDDQVVGAERLRGRDVLPDDHVVGARLLRQRG